jgi:hypothetical protein
MSSFITRDLETVLKNRSNNIFADPNLQEFDFGLLVNDSPCVTKCLTMHLYTQCPNIKSFINMTPHVIHVVIAYMGSCLVNKHTAAQIERLDFKKTGLVYTNSPLFDAINSFLDGRLKKLRYVPVDKNWVPYDIGFNGLASHLEHFAYHPPSETAVSKIEYDQFNELVSNMCNTHGIDYGDESHERFTFFFQQLVYLSAPLTQPFLDLVKDCVHMETFEELSNEPRKLDNIMAMTGLKHLKIVCPLSLDQESLFVSFFKLHGSRLESLFISIPDMSWILKTMSENCTNLSDLNLGYPGGASIEPLVDAMCTMSSIGSLTLRGSKLQPKHLARIREANRHIIIANEG